MLKKKDLNERERVHPFVVPISENGINGRVYKLLMNTDSLLVLVPLKLTNQPKLFLNV